jgi:hypothetical protein
MAYRGTQQRAEGDPAEVLHQAGEVRQRELVAQIAAGPSAFEILVPVYQAERTSRLRCLILDALPGKDDPQLSPLIEMDDGEAVPSFLHHG